MPATSADHEQPYPRFSDAELDRRRAHSEQLILAKGLDALILYGADRSGTAVRWLTEWPVTREAAVLVQPGRPDLLLVQFRNHVPNATVIAYRAEVRWGGADTMRTVCAELDQRGAARIGTIGGMRERDHRLLAERSADVVSLDTEYVRLRLVKSPEEIEWMTKGAELSDRAVLALRDQVRPGIDEYDLGAIVESSYLGKGGTTLIHYFGVTAMDGPALAVPRQWPTARSLQSGDVLVTELSASWWGYPGQVLRTMVLADEPNEVYAKLHEVADAAYDAILGMLRPGVTADEVINAGSVIEDAGFTTYDDLVHGFGGGYLPPVIASRSRADAPVPTEVFMSGMTVVIQPNVVTTDEAAGVQTGGLVLVTDDGAVPLQRAERGLWCLG